MTTIETLRRQAEACTACPLYRHATPTVFGEGDPGAAMVLVGEQPGDEEDRAGRPSPDEIEACRPWLEQELWLIRPEVVVCLGVTAARSVLKRRVTVSEARGDDLRRAARVSRQVDPGRKERTTG